MYQWDVDKTLYSSFKTTDTSHIDEEKGKALEEHHKRTVKKLLAKRTLERFEAVYDIKEEGI